MPRAALIQVNFNKYPVTVRESLASGSWPVPEVPGRRNVHKGGVGIALRIGTPAANGPGE